MSGDRKVVLRVFAGARALVGADRVELAIPAQATIADVRAALLSTAPELSVLAARSRFALGSRFVDDAAIVGDEELALIPPVSGG